MAGINIAKVHVWGSDCLGEDKQHLFSIVSNTQYWLHQVECESWANGYHLVLGFLVVLDVSPGCILVKGTSKLMNVFLENSPTVFIDTVCHTADEHGSAQSKS